MFFDSAFGFYVMDSSSKADCFISTLRDYTRMGFTPGEIVPKIFEQLDMSYEELTFYDQERINSAIAECGGM